MSILDEFETEVVGWRLDAACRGADPRLFFPERGEATWPAKQICAQCPVTSECFDAGLGEKHGIWGGLSERQRRRRRAALSRLPRTVEAPSEVVVPLFPHRTEPCLAANALEQARRDRAAEGSEPNGGIPKLRGRDTRAYRA